MIDFNPSSTKHLSTLLFGGEVKYVEKIPNGIFKSGERKGEIKYKNEDKIKKFNGLVKPLKEWKSEAGNISTGDTVLQILAKRQDKDAGKIAKILLEIRKLEKELNTYYNAIGELIYDFDSTVKGQLCHCGYDKGSEFGGGTSTGRLSSRHPNLQNFPRAADSQVREFFSSRYGDNGIIIECDYKQLEVVVFAFLTQDVQLIEDINNGIDIHRILASRLYRTPEALITNEQRQQTKFSTFHVIYGGGYKSLAKRENIDEEIAKKFIDIFYERYPQAKLWQDNLVRQVNNTRDFDKKLAYFQSVTGRIYYFPLMDQPYKNGNNEIWVYPPNIKNYPVQGLATADIVLIMLGKLWRQAIENRDKFLLINTVHDSVVIDCKKEFLDFTCNLVKNELELGYEILKNLFNIDFNVPLKIDIKTGKDWRKCGL
jgi:DNA polymerase-1